MLHFLAQSSECGDTGKACTQIDIAVPEDLLEAEAYAQTMSAAEVEAVLNRIVDQHGDDPNFPPGVLEAANRYLFDDDLKDQPEEYRRLYDELKIDAAMITINSPYAEVRAVVDNHDDPQVPASTFPTWVLGTILVAAGAFLNQFFSIRYPTIGVGSNVAQVVAVPLLKMLELLPDIEFHTFGYVWSLNPCAATLFDMMMLTPIMRFVLVGLSTSLIGYGLAGLTRRFLVYPAHAIWLVSLCEKTIALNRALHTGKKTVANGWSMSRLRWFLYCFCGMFIYFWFPGFICQSLSYFNWMTWISPTNVSLAAITGSVFGLGFNPLPTFDWNVATLTVDPLITPFFALFTFPIIVALWYTNTWNTGYLPINSNFVFDNTGNLYSVANILGSDKLFNQTMYEAYSPAYHTFLYHRREIMHGFRSTFSRDKTSHLHMDVHVRLMETYKELPEWQYFMQCVAIVVGAVGVGVYPTNTSPIIVLSGVFLAVIFVIPIGIIASITNVEITLNVLAEFFGRLWFPGNAIAMNYLKAYGFITTSQAINFAADLKLAHYMHIPPRLTFFAQIYATIISTFVCTGILNFQMTKIPGVCTPQQVHHFTCPDVNTFFTAWCGTLGPKRMFGAGGIYNGLLWCFLIGALLPIPVYLLRKKVKALEYLHFPVLLNGGLIWAPYSLAFLWPAVPIGFLFNVFIKRRYVAWWSKYNYVTTTAFSAAIAICGIVIFFGIEWPGVEINWSGNTRPFEGCDAMGCARLPLPEQGFFGPGPGEFH
ncbi:OPT-domain-containing protein [Mycena galopus ATCC 62051]|nr:OPT-domain-containing protein [Mycena galopus ATCC 62051]